MMQKRIQTVSQTLIRLPQVRSFGVIGDPGCDGLGTYNMKVYAGALEESAKDDITLIAGDLVPIGTRRYYEMVNQLTEIVAENDIYVLRGNHDTGAYEEYYGFSNYGILADGFAVIVLDNAQRKFEEEGLALLSEILAMEEVTQAVIAFHIPVPNRFIRNSVSEEEYARLKEAFLPWKEKVAYLVCGHVHSRFVDEKDGIPLICSGGGGAMIEDVSEEIRACDVNHHMVHFYMENGRLLWRFQDLPHGSYETERKDWVLKEKLEETVKGELMAHLKYLTFADRARRRGMNRIAVLFEALAASEYYHARNFYSVLEKPAAFLDSIDAFIQGETFEYQQLYRIMADYAGEKCAPLSKEAYESAAAAEKIHGELLSKAAYMEKFSEEKIYVCPICGYVLYGDSIPDRCPVCGGPARQFKEFTEE